MVLLWERVLSLERDLITFDLLTIMLQAWRTRLGVGQGEKTEVFTFVFLVLKEVAHSPAGSTVPWICLSETAVGTAVIFPLSSVNLVVNLQG